MENEGYKERISDLLLQRKLSSSGSVLVTGPKWRGKTWTSLHAAKSVLFMQDPDKRNSYVKLAESTPSLLLRGERPGLLDEWQTAVVLWDAVRFAVDQDPEKGMFILTGSVVVDNGMVEHTGTGRISQLRMRPMSLFESGESNGTVSLSMLFDGGVEVEAESSLDIEGLAFAICRGGWPASISMEREAALEVARGCVDSLCERDATAVDKAQKDPGPGSGDSPFAREEHLHHGNRQNHHGRHKG